jgi:hypothetical protein
VRAFLPANLPHDALCSYANVHDTIGSSNADHPTYQGVIYDPLKPAGKRIGTNMPVG